MATLQDHFNSCLFFSSSALSRALSKLAEREFAVFDLSPTQGFILLTLRKAPGISIGDLGLVLSLGQSTITKAVEKMEQRGLVIRETYGRLTRVFITGKGEEREADAKAAWKKTRLAYTNAVSLGAVEQLCEELATARRKLAGED